MNERIKVRIPISQAIEEDFDLKIGNLVYDKNKPYGRLIENIVINEINIEEKLNRKLKLRKLSLYLWILNIKHQIIIQLVGLLTLL